MAAEPSPPAPSVGARLERLLAVPLARANPLAPGHLSALDTGCVGLEGMVRSVASPASAQLTPARVASAAETAAADAADFVGFASTTRARSALDAASLVPTRPAAAVAGASHAQAPREPTIVDASVRAARALASAERPSSPGQFVAPTPHEPVRSPAERVVSARVTPPDARASQRNEASLRPRPALDAAGAERATLAGDVTPAPAPTTTARPSARSPEAAPPVARRTARVEPLPVLPSRALLPQALPLVHAASPAVPAAHGSARAGALPLAAPPHAPVAPAKLADAATPVAAALSSSAASSVPSLAASSFMALRESVLRAPAARHERGYARPRDRASASDVEPALSSSAARDLAGSPRVVAPPAPPASSAAPGAQPVASSRPSSSGPAREPSLLGDTAASRALARAALAEPARSADAAPRISIEIGRVEIQSRHAGKKAPVRAARPAARRHGIDPGLRIGPGRSW